nr:hypothetical protein [Tanacetum cinerariifolium]
KEGTIIIGKRRIRIQEFQSSLGDTTNVEKSGLGSYPPLPMLGTTVVDLMMEKDKLSSLEDTTVPESFPPLSTPVTTVGNAAGNAPGKSLYANITCKPSRKKVNVRTLFTPEAYRFFLEKNVAYPVIANYKWHPDENLLKEDVSTLPVWVKLHGVPVMAFSEDGLSAISTKLDNIVVAMPKITREGHYTCNFCVEYEWKPSRCSSCKVFGHIHEECPKNTGAGEKKTVKKPSQTSRVWYQWRTTNLVNNKATSSGSSFMNIDNDEEFASNTPIVPAGIVESDSEVEVVFNETDNLRISTSSKDGIKKVMNKSGGTKEREKERERRTKRSKRSGTMDCTHLLTRIHKFCISDSK